MEKKEITEIVSQVIREMGDTGASKEPVTDVTLAMALRLIEAVEAEAKRMGVRAVVAVANKGGRPVAVHCMDESFIASYDIALNKAYTCAALKMPTSRLKQLSQPGGELYGIQHTNQGQIVIFGGGVPVTYGGKVIGGLGVSGGSEAQDTALAEYGEKRMKEADLWQ